MCDVKIKLHRTEKYRTAKFSAKSARLFDVNAEWPHARISHTGSGDSAITMHKIAHTQQIARKNILRSRYQKAPPIDASPDAISYQSRDENTALLTLDHK